MRVRYERVTELDEVLARIGALAPRTVIFDVEPLVAHWDTDDEALARGVGQVFDLLTAAAPAIEVLGFATNSRRHLALLPEGGTIRVVYLALAGKPLRTLPYRDLPRPGVVIGDQVATDGVLAWRLGYAFLHYRPPVPVPRGPRLMGHLGRPLRVLLFRRAR